jgi:hypothetical protein
MLSDSATANPSSRGSGLRTVLLALLVGLLPIPLYSYSLNFPFFCDDFFIYSRVAGTSYTPAGDTYSRFHNVYNIIDPKVHQAHPHLLPWWASPDMKMLYLRPVSSLTLELDHALWGRNPAGYRLSSFLIHGLCAVLVFLLGRLLFSRNSIGLVASLVFTAHLSTIITLPYVIDRVSPVALLFGLLGLTLHILFRKTGRRVLELVAWLSFIAAFLSRESGVVCLASYFLYDFFIWKKQEPEKWPGIVRSCLTYLLLGVPFFIFFTYFVTSGYGVAGYYSAFGEGRSLTQTVVYVAKNVLLYINSLLFFSFIDNDNNLYLFRRANYLIPFLVMIGLALVLLRPWIRHRLFRDRGYLFLICWLFLFLFPNLYLIPQNRYLYAALPPFGLFLGRYLVWLWETRFTFPGTAKRVARLPLSPEASGRVNSWIERRLVKALVCVLVFFYAVFPIAAANLGRSALSEHYYAQTRIVEETRAALTDFEPPVNVLFINLPDPLTTFALQAVFDYYTGKDRIRAFPLTVSKEVPEVEVLSDRSLRITSRGTPFLEKQFERMFLTELPNREGFSRSNPTGTACASGRTTPPPTGAIPTPSSTIPATSTRDRPTTCYS